VRCCCGSRSTTRSSGSRGSSTSSSPTHIAALGLNLLTGYNGQISVGHGAFFGAGAYTTAILVADHGWPHFATLGVAAVIAFALGVLVGLPALRIKGLYLALVTLALATVFPLVITRFSSVTGGTQGKRVPRFRAPAWTGLADDQWKYYVLLAFAVVSFVLVRNLIKSRVGRALIATRDNETAAEVLGVNLSVYKVVTFGVSAMLAGIAGSLSVFNDPFVNAEKYNLSLSITLAGGGGDRWGRHHLRAGLRCLLRGDDPRVAAQEVPATLAGGSSAAHSSF